MTRLGTMVEQLADFNNIMNYLENTRMKLEDKDNTLLLLIACPKRHFSTIKIHCCLENKRSLL